jgi:basic membrane protein A
MRTIPQKAIAALVGALLVGSVATACGSSDKAGSSDTGGGAKKTVALVVAGDRSDGGFYQGQVDAVQELDDSLGYKTIIVDKVDPGASQEAFTNLARQNPDVIIGGGQELTDGFVPACQAPEFSRITWILVAPITPTDPCYATVDGDENQAHFMGGVAEALLLKSAKESTACVVAGPELDFVKNEVKAQRAGLKYEGSDAKLLVTYTGDFENASLAQEAASAQINQGCKLLYAYLGGALPAALKVGQQANADLVATSYDQCDSSDPKFAMSILYNPSIYLANVIKAWADGQIKEGSLFKLYGVNDGIGAVICNPTPEQTKTMQEVAQKVASGEIDVAKLMAAESSS